MQVVGSYAWTEAAMEEMRIQALYQLRDQMRAERMRAEEEGE
ncbi:hypothetical protein ACFV2Q_30155 [Streptomyces sp. NPDC059650]